MNAKKETKRPLLLFLWKESESNLMDILLFFGKKFFL